VCKLGNLFSGGRGIFLSAVSMLLLISSCFGQPTITLSVSGGPPTTTMLDSGSGFALNDPVNIYFDKTDETLIMTDGNGSFQNAAAHALGSALPGRHWVTALNRNNRQGAQSPFLVFTNWAQFQFDASHTGLNPYENVISKSSVSQLALAWEVTELESSASPAVADGLLYAASIGNNKLYAFNALSGTLVWFSYPDCSLVGSPAFAAGIVYDQDTCGSVYAWNAKTGFLIWKEQLFNVGGSSPAILNGVVYIAVANGETEVTTLYALDATTGTTLWTAPVGTHSSPDFPPTPALGASMVYVITEGELFALDAHTGTQLWTYTVGNVKGLYPAPCVADGVVYASSLDNNVYALNATTGALIWKVLAGASTTPAVANGMIYTGTTGGTLIALSADTGTLRWHFTTGGLISSSPAVANGVVVDSSWDGNVYAWDADSGALLWQYTTDDGLTPAPAVANGALWLGGFNVYAFTLKSDDTPESSASEIAPDMSTLQPKGALLPYTPENH